MKLSKRLEMVASFVEKGSRIADIGTDHGYLPIALVERGLCPRAIAMDIGQGPLARAREHILACGMEDRIEMRLSDGLSELKLNEADTVVIAGMGGELVLHILEQGKALWESTGAFVLSPQSELDKVRNYLEKNGFFIAREAMVFEDGKFYTVMLVKRGKMSIDCPAHYLYGKCLIEARDSVLVLYLEKEKARMQAILQDLEGQETKKAEKAREKLLCELRWIKEVQDEMQGNH
ncbi:MAG: SAM-dependent methyltransferase [Lachnospiraceae bacterium]|nr:SAM-dependent methyltransferase [Lachnospiraceae bacterium]